MFPAALLASTSEPFDQPARSLDVASAAEEIDSIEVIDALTARLAAPKSPPLIACTYLERKHTVLSVERPSATGTASSTGRMPSDIGWAEISSPEMPRLHVIAQASRLRKNNLSFRELGVFWGMMPRLALIDAVETA